MINVNNNITYTEWLLQIGSYFDDERKNIESFAKIISPKYPEILGEWKTIPPKAVARGIANGFYEQLN